MAKLDLSALKKQKISSGTPLDTSSTQAFMSQNEGGGVISPITSEAAISLPLATPQKEPEIMRAFENPHKPKLSLSNFKKPNSVSTPVATPVVTPQNTPSIVEKIAPIAPVTLVEPVAEVVVQEVISREVETSSGETPVAHENEKPEMVSTTETSKTLTIEPEVTEETQPMESKAPPLGAEFFPNLEFENDNLFADIVGMWSFGEEKSEKPAEALATPMTIQNEAIAPESLETAIETVVMEALPTVTTMEEVTADEVLPTETVTINESTEVLVSTETSTQSSNDVIAHEVWASSVDTLSANTSSVVTLEQVETVARNLSKDRKGGLKALFDNHKKVFYGVGAFMVTSVMVIGGLSGLGIIDMGGTKASTFEKSQVVAVKTTPKTPDVNVVKKPDTVTTAPTASGASTLTGANTGTGQMLYPPIVVTSSGTSMVISGTGGLIPAKGTGSVTLSGATRVGTGMVTASNGTGSVKLPGIMTQTGAAPTVVPVKTQTGTIIVTPTPGTTVNTYRTPNNKSKNRK